MLTSRLNLIVLRVADIDRSAEFYSRLGMMFEKHSHGTGPVHCAAVFAGIVFELYTASTNHPVTSSVRIGFEVSDVSRAISALDGCRLISPIAESEWGLRAVIADPDGHRVELTQSAASKVVT